MLGVCCNRHSANWEDGVVSEYTDSISPTEGAYIHRPDGKKVPLVQAVYELNNLLARAEKAETALENREVVLAQMQSAINATYAETHHPDIGSAERKPMMPHERIAWLGEDRDNWEARTKAAEAERDDLMRKLSEARVKEHWEASETERQLFRRAEAAEAERDELRRKLYPGKDEELFGVVKSRVIDWQRVRIDMAIAAMHGILAGNLYRELLSNDGWPEQRAAFLAIDYANMLTEELKKEVAE